MPTQPYRCTNFSGCNKALERETIHIEDGEESICPECGFELQPVPPRVGIPKWAFAVVGLLMVALVAAWLLWPKPKSNPMETANKMLTEFYPQLPPK